MNTVELSEELLRTVDLGLPEPSPAALDALEADGHARNGFCEKCWAAAFGRALAHPGRSQSEHYLEIVTEINALGTPAKEGPNHAGT